MLIVISPAKSLNFEPSAVTSKYTIPEFLGKSEKLVAKLKKMSPRRLSALMGISKELSELNFERYQKWQVPFTPENAKQAVLAFNGDVYQGLDANTFSEEKLEMAQKQVRILSGLYGVLRPLDLIQPYRLEMGIPLKYQRSADLYEFWNPELSKNIKNAVDEAGGNVLVNLASKEYFKSIDTKILKTEIISPEFRDLRNGKYIIISFFAKKARGLMTRFILENNIRKVADLQAFDLDGYQYNQDMSQSNKPVFTREN